MSRRLAPRPGRIAGLVLAALVWSTFALAASAASPSPGPATGGDPRSSGQGPGLVGDPAFALLAVLTISLVTVAATLIYVRLTARTGR